MRVTAWTEEMQFHRRIVEAADVLGWITVADGYCVYLSPAWYAFTGVNRDSHEGYQWLSAIHLDDQVRVRRRFFEANDRGKEYSLHYRLQNHEGRYEVVWAYGMPQFNSEGQFLGYLGTTSRVVDASSLKDVLETRLEKIEHPGVLTKRQREIFTLLASGSSNVSIAAALDISERTVENHVRRAIDRLGANNRVHALSKAVLLNEISLSAAL